MYLRSISLINFKNHKNSEFRFTNGINCFVGKNGTGKTNILDAVSYLSMTKSYLNPVDKQNINFGEHFFIIQGYWETEIGTQEIYCGVKIGQKKIIKKNKLEYEKIADHIGLFPSVMISPYDRDLISEGSEIRRKWMDGIISQFNRAYLDSLIRYGKVLEQRNTILKQINDNRIFDIENLDIWDEQLIPLGNQINKIRIEFIADFLPIFSKYYSYIGTREEDVKIEYKSQLTDENFENLLINHQKKDCYSQHTTVGTHKDDLLFTINENPIKKFGSQGQQKSFLIALKLAQYEWLSFKLNKKPLLMLDDIFDKLDQTRVKQLINLVSSSSFGQVLLTDTDIERVNKLFNGLNVSYNIIEIDKLQQNVLSDERI